MKVKDLIVQLQKLDGNLDVYCYTEDERFATTETPFHLFDVSHVQVNPAILSRDGNGKVGVKWENEGGAIKLAVIEVTADF